MVLDEKQLGRYARNTYIFRFLLDKYRIENDKREVKKCDNRIV